MKEGGHEQEGSMKLKEFLSSAAEASKTQQAAAGQRHASCWNSGVISNTFICT